MLHAPPAPTLSKVCGHGHIKKLWLMQTQRESENNKPIPSCRRFISRPSSTSPSSSSSSSSSSSDQATRQRRLGVINHSSIMDCAQSLVPRLCGGGGAHSSSSSSPATSSAASDGAQQLCSSGSSREEEAWGRNRSDRGEDVGAEMIVGGGGIELTAGEDHNLLLVQQQSSPSRTCSMCGTNRTPLWRSGPRGPKSLCNACGIRFKKSRRCSSSSVSGSAAASSLAFLPPPSSLAECGGHHQQIHYFKRPSAAAGPPSPLASSVKTLKRKSHDSRRRNNNNSGWFNSLDLDALHDENSPPTKKLKWGSSSSMSQVRPAKASSSDKDQHNGEDHIEAAMCPNRTTWITSRNRDEAKLGCHDPPKIDGITHTRLEEISEGTRIRTVDVQEGLHLVTDEGRRLHHHPHRRHLTSRSSVPATCAGLRGGGGWGDMAAAAAASAEVSEAAALLVYMSCGLVFA